MQSGKTETVRIFQKKIDKGGTMNEEFQQEVDRYCAFGNHAVLRCDELRSTK